MLEWLIIPESPPSARIEPHVFEESMVVW